MNMDDISKFFDIVVFTSFFNFFCSLCVVCVPFVMRLCFIDFLLLPCVNKDIMMMMMMMLIIIIIILSVK